VKRGSALRLFLGGVRECDGLAVRAARGATAGLFTMTDKPVYAEEVARTIVDYTGF
jgi:hypothetical protein